MLLLTGMILVGFWGTLVVSQVLARRSWVELLTVGLMLALAISLLAGYSKVIAFIVTLVLHFTLVAAVLVIHSRESRPGKGD